MNVILIVDDQANIRRAISYTLRKSGYDTLIASNGKEGFTLLQKLDVDLAIIDITMPEMDGITLLNLIRKHETLKTLPVIVLTALGDDKKMAEIEQIGCQKILTKPVGSQVLIETIQNLLSSSD